MSVRAEPQTSEAGERTELLGLADIRQEFSVRGGRAVRALDDIDLSIRRGETLGVVGESGCGKSTLARVAMSLQRPTAGTVRFAGEDITGLRGAALRRHRARTQMVFQDPNDSFDPRFTVGRSVSEPLRAARVPAAQLRERVAQAIAQVGLEENVLSRYPHEFSGGQRQRIALARALSTSPDFIVLDEPTSALDVSVQAQMLGLLDDLQAAGDLTFMFISHNLAVVHHLSHRVAVMYLGRVVELAERDALFAQPRHPYTRALLSAAPDPHADARERIVLHGDLPSPQSRYPGCAFASRCWLATEECRTTRPPLAPDAAGRIVACHHSERTADPIDPDDPRVDVV